MSSVEPHNGAVGASGADLEEALSRIPSVTAARVVTGQGGRVAEVHLLARRDRAPKQLVRDVQSVALATFGVEVDYRTVSVVQLEDQTTEISASIEGAPRIIREKVSADVAGPTTEIRVHTTCEGREFIGVARGPGASWVRLVVRAALDAVLPLLGSAAVDVEFADVLSAGGHSVALVILRTVGARGDEVVSGSAVAQRDLHDAIARATLAALNRLAAQALAGGLREG